MRIVATWQQQQHITADHANIGAIFETVARKVTGMCVDVENGP